MEPTCANLPDPELDAPDNGLRRRVKEVSKIKLGEVMLFECINRTNRHETPLVNISSVLHNIFCHTKSVKIVKSNFQSLNKSPSGKDFAQLNKLTMAPTDLRGKVQ